MDAEKRRDPCGHTVLCPIARQNSYLSLLSLDITGFFEKFCIAIRTKKNVEAKVSTFFFISFFRSNAPGRCKFRRFCRTFVVRHIPFNSYIFSAACKERDLSAEGRNSTAQTASPFLHLQRLPQGREPPRKILPMRRPLVSCRPRAGRLFFSDPSCFLRHALTKQQLL